MESNSLPTSKSPEEIEELEYQQAKVTLLKSLDNPENFKRIRGVEDEEKEAQNILEEQLTLLNELADKIGESEERAKDFQKLLDDTISPEHHELKKVYDEGLKEFLK